MNDSERERWQRWAASRSLIYRPLARRIVRHTGSHFEMLWLLMDFAQLGVRHAALVVLNYGFRDLAARRAIFHRPLTTGLERPSFGHWLGFLRDAVKSLVEQRLPLPITGLERLLHESMKATCDRITSKRNRLAHGQGARFDATCAEVDEMSRFILTLVEIVANESGEDLPPFVLASNEEQAPLLYDRIDDGKAIYSSDDVHTSRGDLGQPIKEFLRSGKLPFGQVALAELAADDLRDRSTMLLRHWLYQAGTDVLMRDAFLSELPPFAGRPALARQLTRTLEAAQNSWVLHLFGMRGIGKRRFVGELLQDWRRREHLIVPLAEPGKSVAAWQAAPLARLMISGTLSELAEATCRFDPQLRTILVVDQAVASLSAPSQCAAFVQFVHALPPNVHMLLWSDGLEPLPPMFSPAIEFFQLALPPLELDSAREFYQSMVLHEDHAPLTEWELLPPEARQMAQLPMNLVRLCQKYHGRPVPREFSPANDWEESWQNQVIDHPLRCQLVRRWGMDPLERQSTTVSPKIFNAIQQGDRETRRACDDLRLLGIVDETTTLVDGQARIGWQFVEYEGLLRALLLAMALPSAGLTSEQASQWFKRAESYAPLADSMALWCRNHPQDRLTPLFEAAVSLQPACVSSLIESLLREAYPYPDLHDYLFDQVWQSGSEAIIRGGAAAAQNLVRAGDLVARQLGQQQYEALLSACVRHNLSQLETKVLHEMAHEVIDGRDLDTQASAYARALSLAEREGWTDWILTARNNLSSLEVERAESLRRQQRPGYEDLAREVIARLTPDLATIENDSYWEQRVIACETFARACALLPEPRALDAVDYQRQAIDICRRYGTSQRRGQATLALAKLLVNQGQSEAALSEFERAADWLRIAGDHLSEVDALRGHARVLISLSQKQSPPAVDLLRRTITELRQAKRLLLSATQLPGATERLGHVWFDLADVFRILGEPESASDCVRQCLDHLERERSSSCEQVRSWARRHGLDTV